MTFIDNNKRFVSTSDDKTIRVWEYGIPVQVKYIADPGMHSMPFATTSFDKQWYIAQSLDNQIVTYTANDRFKCVDNSFAGIPTVFCRATRKKTFRGHSVSGYACAVGFSGDNKYVISGDGGGRIFVWDWKTTRIFRSIKVRWRVCVICATLSVQAHDKVCIGVAWHPLESSKVATCGWDGLIKYWE